MSSASLWSVCAWCAVLAALVAEGALFRSASKYAVETNLLVNSVGGKRRDVGYRLAATLSLRPVWEAPAPARDQLIQFTLESPRLLLMGAYALADWRVHASLWDERARDVFYARRTRGRLLAAYLDPRDPPDVLNYKRALLSLFQFQVPSDGDEGGDGGWGERNETDVSGECLISYESLSPTVFRKIKRRCGFENGGSWGPRARRVSRYTLTTARDALSGLHAEEVVWVTAGEEEGVGVKARSWSTLELIGAPTAPTPAPHAELDAALAALPDTLVPTPLQLPPPPPDTDDESLESALEAGRAALEGWGAGGGGSRAAAAALPPLLRALRAAPASALHSLLQRVAVAEDGALLGGVCRALGLAGTRAAWQAARALLQPAASEALEAHVHHYLAGLALSDAPHEDVVDEVLTLGAEARLTAIGESALLAGAAAARRCSDAVRGAARERLSRALARCKDEACRAVRLRALGNLQDPAAAELLVAAAERGSAATAALGALRSLGPSALSGARLERLGALARNASRALAERAQALELVVEAQCTGSTDTVPLQVARMARALVLEHGAAAHELRRALWQRLDALEARPEVVALRRVLPAELVTWDARAHGGTTSVLRRDTGWALGGRAAMLDSVQLAARGVLLRGAVSLLTAGARELLAVEVETRGLAGLAGAEDGDDEGEGGPAARLQLAVDDAALRPVTLFDGQAELVGHIWAGTGSAPTGVVRALVPGGTWAGTVPLQAGATLVGRAHAAAALSLDAHATVSLWYRTARARLSLRAGAAAAAHATVRTHWSELRARVEGGTDAARLRIAADLDFYEGMTLCVRAHLDDHDERGAVRLESVGGARALRVTRTGETRTARAGRTLALGRTNDAACRVLRAMDPDEDDPVPDQGTPATD